MYHTRKEWFSLLKETLLSYPYDHSYLLRLEQIKLKEMIAYHKKAQRFVGVEKVIRDMNIAVGLLDIMLGNKDLFHFDGDLLFNKIEGKDEYEVVKSTDFKYVSDINVNLRNIDRFIPKERQKIYLDMPHELYIEKAKVLYYKIRLEHTDEWWD